MAMNLQKVQDQFELVPDGYLTQKISEEPQTLETLIAVGELNSRNQMRQSQQTPSDQPTVAEDVVQAAGGMGSLPMPISDNVPPGIVEGINTPQMAMPPGMPQGMPQGMPPQMAMRPDVMDQGLTGLPTSPDMYMNNGGIVGFVNRGFVVLGDQTYDLSKMSPEQQQALLEAQRSQAQALQPPLQTLPPRAAYSMFGPESQVRGLLQDRPQTREDQDREAALNRPGWVPESTTELGDIIGDAAITVGELASTPFTAISESVGESAKGGNPYAQVLVDAAGNVVERVSRGAEAIINYGEDQPAPYAYPRLRQAGEDLGVGEIGGGILATLKGGGFDEIVSGVGATLEGGGLGESRDKLATWLVDKVAPKYDPNAGGPTGAAVDTAAEAEAKRLAAIEAEAERLAAIEAAAKAAADDADDAEDPPKPKPTKKDREISEKNMLLMELGLGVLGDTETTGGTFGAVGRSGIAALKTSALRKAAKADREFKKTTLDLQQKAIDATNTRTDAVYKAAIQNSGISQNELMKLKADFRVKEYPQIMRDARAKLQAIEDDKWPLFGGRLNEQEFNEEAIKFGEATANQIWMGRFITGFMGSQGISGLASLGASPTSGGVPPTGKYSYEPIPD